MGAFVENCCGCPALVAQAATVQPWGWHPWLSTPEVSDTLYRTITISTDDGNGNTAELVLTYGLWSGLVLSKSLHYWLNGVEVTPPSSAPLPSIPTSGSRISDTQFEGNGALGWTTVVLSDPESVEMDVLKDKLEEMWGAHALADVPEPSGEGYYTDRQLTWFTSNGEGYSGTVPWVGATVADYNALVCGDSEVVRVVDSELWLHDHFMSSQAAKVFTAGWATSSFVSGGTAYALGTLTRNLLPGQSICYRESCNATPAEEDACWKEADSSGVLSLDPYGDPASPSYDEYSLDYTSASGAALRKSTCMPNTAGTDCVDGDPDTGPSC